jgi:hypothetical protein
MHQGRLRFKPPDNLQVMEVMVEYEDFRHYPERSLALNIGFPDYWIVELYISEPLRVLS